VHICNSGSEDCLVKKCRKAWFEPFYRSILLGKKSVKGLEQEIQEKDLLVRKTNRSRFKRYQGKKGQGNKDLGGKNGGGEFPQIPVSATTRELVLEKEGTIKFLLGPQPAPGGSRELPQKDEKGGPAQIKGRRFLPSKCQSNRVEGNRKESG